jgi:hypothetical protein
MFDKVSRLAERAAVDLSRRAFLTRLGLGAMAFATFVGEAAAKHKPPPPSQCILNGGCCGGAYPYLAVDSGICCSDSRCLIGGICTVSNCCGGAGSCANGQCWSDNSCGTPC